MDLVSIIGELSQIPGPAGFEDAAAKRFAELIAPFSDEVRRDPLGNVIACHKCGIENAPKLLVDAHIDEIGLIITGTEDGFLKFQNLGSIDPRILPGTEVEVLTDPPLYGVIACLPPHVLSAKERESVMELKNLYIDTGSLPDDNALPVPAGTPCVFKGAFTHMQDGYYTAKALDDRVGIALLIDLAERISKLDLNIDVYFMASVQEELGVRGAGPGVFSVEPDYCVAVDVAYGQAPGTPKTGTFKLGCGAVVGVGPNMNRNLTNRIFDVCEKYNIPHETEVLAANSGTNLWAIQISRNGIATALVSVPVRYMHSPVELLKLSDVSNASDVLFNLINDWGKNNA